MKHALICITLVLLAAISGLSYSVLKTSAKLDAALKAPSTQPPREPLLTLTNAAILNMGNALIIRVADAEWTVLTNAYPTNVRTDTLTFFKDPAKK